MIGRALSLAMDADDSQKRQPPSPECSGTNSSITLSGLNSDNENRSDHVDCNIGCSLGWLFHVVSNLVALSIGAFKVGSTWDMI